MSKNKPQGKKVTYNQLMGALGETVRGLQQAYHRIANLEQYIAAYIEHRKTGKRFNRWLEKKHQAAAKESNESRTNEKADGENLEATTADQGRRPEGVRAP
tara:strand:+ start:301 stop:603 length:303 start_codon:yes stop_codon:yes gene_type:complete